MHSKYVLTTYIVINQIFNFKIDSLNICYFGLKIAFAKFHLRSILLLIYALLLLLFCVISLLSKLRSLNDARKYNKILTSSHVEEN